MTSNPPNHSDQLWELAKKLGGEWPYEKPVQTITTNVIGFLSRVSSHQQNFQFNKRKRNAEGSSTSSSYYNMQTLKDCQKSKDVLLESVQIEKAILQSRMDQLDELEKLCQIIQSEIDQQQQREEEEEQKAKEAEKRAVENAKKKQSVASKIFDAVLGKQQQKQQPQSPNLVSNENGVEKISATVGTDEYKYQPKQHAVPKVVSSSSSSLVTYRGLYNQGQTCALNSVLQTLFMTPQFRQMIIREASEAKCYYKINQQAKLYIELGKLFEHLQYDKWGSANSTEAFTKALGWTRKETGQQCDAHTVFRDILTALQGQPSSSRSKLINDIFHTELVDLTKCTECGDTMKQIQTVPSLAVPIQGHTSVEDCLNSFFNNVDETPGFACQKCDKLVTVKKKWQCSKVPEILAVNLMRFHFQQNGSRVVKLDDRLSFNTVLSGFGPQNIYELYAVINHSGTVDGGHYYAYIRDPQQDQWFEFNDAVVSPLTHVTHHGVQQIAGHRNYELKSSNAYILFYRKIGPMLASATEGCSV